MGNNGELRLPFEEDEKTMNVNPTNDTSSMNLDQPRRSLQTKPNYKRWLRIGVYTFLLLSGQSVGTMLGRLYFDKGGKSKWLATLVSLIGFPILLPLYMIKSPKISSSNITLQSNPPTTTKLIFVYVSLGLLVAINCFLYSVGLMYLHVSTFSLICASQLAFNALFSYFINSLVFTPFIVNSLVLLTISSSLLVFQSDPVSDTSSDGPGHPTSRAKFITGFVHGSGLSRVWPSAIPNPTSLQESHKKGDFQGSIGHDHLPINCFKFSHFDRLLCKWGVENFENGNRWVPFGQSFIQNDIVLDSHKLATVLRWLCGSHF
ncbi:probable purine permease 10 isoform X2 [Cucurbita maxima]|uniref:Probable purine permease n=1 Tax=Cucurbita maxima TaxID=3661 RepID=A0A6J1JX15_CUCMA|nr:probable purine permease 10 isoform X1 [Cucurbita maxima]XP_022994847.1 probable purine permease 10 isoform X2 [Cucurbita maxima]